MSAPDLTTPASVAAFLRRYQKWRRRRLHDELDEPGPPMLSPRDVGVAIDAAIAMLERFEAVEQERASFRADLSKQQSLTEAAQKLAEIAQRRANSACVKLEAMRQQEPVGTLHDDGYFVWNASRPYESSYAGWKMKLYAMPGAQGENNG